MIHLMNVISRMLKAGGVVRRQGMGREKRGAQKGAALKAHPEGKLGAYMRNQYGSWTRPLEPPRHH